VKVGDGVRVLVGGAVGRGVSTTGRKGVGVEVLFGSRVMVDPDGVGGAYPGAVQPPIRNRIHIIGRIFPLLADLMLLIPDQ
jgi:hypothetical protein